MVRKTFFIALFLIAALGINDSWASEVYRPIRHGNLTFVPGLVGLNTPPPTGKPIPSGQWNDETKLWLARSVVGEAEFDAYEEHIAIAWVYATIHKQKGMEVKRIIRAYSAAVKRKSTGRRAWILNLRLDGKRPKAWPEHLSWKKHRIIWFKVLDNLEQWAIGNRPNPVHGANHYGGKMDSPGIRWVRVKAPFKNIFYIARSSN